MAGDYGDAGTALPVPDSDRLVVAGTEDPREFVVELDGADVVHVAGEREETSLLLVVPDFQLVVVAPADKQWLRAVERYSSYRPYLNHRSSIT